MTNPDVVRIRALLPAARSTDQRAIINDSVRLDGGKPTEDVSVAPEQIKQIEKTALDHTADEAGS